MNGRKQEKPKVLGKGSKSQNAGSVVVVPFCTVECSAHLQVMREGGMILIILSPTAS